MTTLHKDMPGFICCACSLYRFFPLVLSSPWDSDKRNINLFVCHVHVEKLTNKTEQSWTEKRGGNDLLFVHSWNVCFSVWKFILQYFFIQDSYELFSQHLACVNLVIFPTSCLKAWRCPAGMTDDSASSGRCSTWSACQSLPREPVFL